MEKLEGGWFQEEVIAESKTRVGRCLLCWENRQES